MLDDKLKRKGVCTKLVDEKVTRGSEGTRMCS
jgi:hypothetical protein